MDLDAYQLSNELGSSLHDEEGLPRSDGEEPLEGDGYEPSPAPPSNTAHAFGFPEVSVQSAPFRAVTSSSLSQSPRGFPLPFTMPVPVLGSNPPSFGVPIASAFGSSPSQARLPVAESPRNTAKIEMVMNATGKPREEVSNICPSYYTR